MSDLGPHIAKRSVLQMNSFHYVYKNNFQCFLPGATGQEAIGQTIVVNSPLQKSTRSVYELKFEMNLGPSLTLYTNNR